MGNKCSNDDARADEEPTPAQTQEVKQTTDSGAKEQPSAGSQTTEKAETTEKEEAGGTEEAKEEVKPREKEKIDIQTRYQFKRTLGKGASCRVVEAVDKQDKSFRLAIKIMDKSRKMFRKLYDQEVDVLSKLSDNATRTHKNVIRFINNTEDELNFYILTEMCLGGELFDRIVSKDERYIITEKTAAGLVRCMCEAVKFCHDQGITHRDLKPENFVFQSEAVDANLVLIDFGCATVMDENKNKTYDNLVGTAYYLAPELAYVALSRSNNADISKKYSPMVKPRNGDVLKAADVWSIGVIAYVMLTGRAPFRGRTNQQIFESIVTNKVSYPEKDVRYKTPLQLSPAFKDFVNKVLVKEPLERLSLEECLRHPWVTGVEASDFKLNQDVVRYLRQFNYQSKLKKAITRVLASNMTKEPEAQVKSHFVRLDADSDGFLDHDELTFLLLDMGYTKQTAGHEATAMIEQADQNKDGLIDFNEFKQIWYRKILSTNDQYIHRVFSVFDANGDGHIDVRELKAVLNPEEDEAEEEEVQEDDQQLRSLASMISEVDLDGDGQISFEEFQKAMKEDMDKGNFRAEAYSVGGDVTKMGLKETDDN